MSRTFSQIMVIMATVAVLYYIYRAALAYRLLNDERRGEMRLPHVYGHYLELATAIGMIVLIIVLCETRMARVTDPNMGRITS